MGPDAIKATRSIMSPSRPFVFWDKNLTGLPHLPSKDMIFQLANQISIYIYKLLSIIFLVLQVSLLWTTHCILSGIDVEMACERESGQGHAEP